MEVRKIIQRIILVLLFITVAIGISYAYYEAVVHGTGNTNMEGSAHTATIQDLILTGTTEVVNTNMIPGESSSYSFTIENPNDYDVCFGIYFDNVTNTFVNTSDLEVSMDGEVGTFPSAGDTSTIISGFVAPADATTSYTITITYKDVAGKDQTGDMGAIISGLIKARADECGTLPSDRTLATLASLNSNYVVSDSANCLHVDQNGMITDHSSIMSDYEEPIVCAMEDDYGTSYYLRGLHTDNFVKFANSCWKIIRVTGTGGIKLIYNGDLDGSGTCTTTSGTHTGFLGTTLTIPGDKLFGSSYTKSGSTYTLTDTSTLNWPNDASSIIGKYYCSGGGSSCTTLYAITGKYTSTVANAIRLEYSTNYAQLGKKAFNETAVSPAYVGYMYNDVYSYISKNLSGDSNNYYYGSSFAYDNNNERPYTLTNTVQFSDITDSTNKTLLNTHHYTCFYGSNNTCDELYFVFYIRGTSLYYIKLEGNEDIDDALDKMLRNDNINVENNHLKGTLDYWYKKTLEGTTYESYLEDTLFCNDRTIDDIGGWSETGDISGTLYFNGGKNKYYLKCPSKRDAFTVSDTLNGNGSLTYPVGILTTTEHILVGNLEANKTGEYYWSLTPYSFTYNAATMRYVYTSGYWSYSNSSTIGNHGIRPSISLKPGTTFASGTDGSPSNPFVVE